MAEDDAEKRTRLHVPSSPPPPRTSRGAVHQPQVSTPNPNFPTPPFMFPMFMPGMHPQQNLEEHAQGPGIYAIQQNPLMGLPGCYPPNMFIPLTYKIPMENAGSAASEGQGQDMRQQHVPQRQVVLRRFQFAFQLDLALIIKLAVVVFLLSQEGSTQRLIHLVLFASLVYLYQTGAIAPLLRWLQQAGAGVVRQPRPHAQVENRAALAAQNDGTDQPPAGNLANPVNPDQAAENPEPGVAAGVENQQGAEGEGNRRNWLGDMLKEVQMIVVGFVASLLPGFQHND